MTDQRQVPFLWTDRSARCLLQEDREWALKRGLDEINKEIETASRADVACWFPMGMRDERIVRLAGKEAQLLNSRQVITHCWGGLKLSRVHVRIQVRSEG